MTTATNDHGAPVAGHVERAGLLQAAAATSSGAALKVGQGDGGRVERSRASTTARPDSYCLHCGRRMSPGRHGRRVYCSNGCRQSAYKQRRRVERAAASTVEGVADGN